VFGWKNGFFLDGALLGEDRLHLARVDRLLDNRAVPIGRGKHVQRVGGGKDHRDLARHKLLGNFKNIGPIKVNVENGSIDAAPAEKADGVKGRGGGADDGGAEIGEATAKIGGEGFVILDD